MMSFPITSSITAITHEHERLRKPNFTDFEKSFLIIQYELYKPLLSSKTCDTQTNRRKHEIWAQITAELNSRNPKVQRTAKDVKKKWENLAMQSRKELTDYRQNHIGNPPSALTLKVLELLEDITLQKSDGSQGGDQGLPATATCIIADHYDQVLDVNSSTDTNGPVDSIRVKQESLDQPSYVGNGICVKEEPIDQGSYVENGISAMEHAIDSGSPSTSQGSSSGTNSNWVPNEVTKKRPASNHDTSNISTDIKELKRLKLQLETEKLMLEKRKLELEIKRLERDGQ